MSCHQHERTTEEAAAFKQALKISGIIVSKRTNFGPKGGFKMLEA